jgi:hypothetical protein
MEMQQKLNSRGCRLLAIAVLKSAIHESLINPEFDWSYFNSDAFHFYAAIAYGGKEDYRSGDDIIHDILKGDIERDLRKENGRQRSKYS